MCKPTIYFAAPLFNETERAFNEKIATDLEEFACVFLPQRDGSLLVDMIAAGVPLKVAESRVFAQDRRALARADMLVAVLDGAHVDDGVAFELGFASAIGCVCIGLQTDVRRALPTGNNPMISGGLQEIFHDIGGLIAWVKDRAAIIESERQAIVAG